MDIDPEDADIPQYEHKRGDVTWSVLPPQAWDYEGKQV